MQKRLAHLMLLFSLFLLAACSSPTASTTVSATATPVPRPLNVYYSAPVPSGQYAINALDGASGKLRWSYATSADFEMPVLAAGTLYLTASAGLIALNASDGKRLWDYSTTANIGIVGVENGVLAASLFDTSGGPLKTSLVALNASTGKLRWNYQFHNGEGNLLSDGVIYSSDTLTPFGTPTSPDGSFMLAFNASDGSLKWKSAQESGYLTPLSVAEGLLYADNSFPMGGPETIEARRTSDGSTAWRFPNGSGHATYLGLQNNMVYVLSDVGSSGDLNQNLYALNSATGAVIWHAEVTPSQQVFANLAPQVLYVGDGADNSLAALNAADGKQLWHTQLGMPNGSANALVTAQAVVDGAVYLTYPDGFAALDASTGAIKWEAQDTSEHSILAVEAGIVYSRSTTTVAAQSTMSGGNGSTITARSASSGAVLWSLDVAGLQDDPIVGSPSGD